MRATKAKRLRRAAREAATDFTQHVPRFWNSVTNKAVDAMSMFTRPLTFAHPAGTFRRIYQNSKKEQ